MELHMKLVSLRKQKGLTQLDLAEKLNVSRQAISRWEVGSAVPSTENLKILSELYEVSVDYLLNDENDNYNTNESYEPAEQNVKLKRKNYKMLLLYVVTLVITILIMLCLFAVHSQEQENDKIVPIEDMETIAEVTYPTGTFSIG